MRMCLLCIILVLCFTVCSLASSVAQVSFEQMVKTSELIFQGRVSNIICQLDSPNAIHTYVTFEVDDVFKGALQSRTITLRYLGGTVGNRTLHVSDVVTPAIGEAGIYFVESVAHPQAHPLYGWDQGHFVLVRDKNDRTERVFSRSGSPITGFSNPARKAVQLSNGIAFGLSTADSASGAAAMALRDFKKRILEIAQRP